MPTRGAQLIQPAGRLKSAREVFTRVEFENIGGGTKWSGRG